MLQETIFAVMVVLLLASIFVMVGQRIKIPYPIMLVLAGIGLAFLPGTPEVQVGSELIMLIFLPPILFEAAWNTHWNEFWKFRRPIMMFAFGLVFLTATAVAYTSVWLIPGFTLSLGFLLGGIISPTDAVSATSVLKHFGLPKNIERILEGESLLNDASGLSVVRFSLLAAVTGMFSFQQAVGSFLLMATLGLAIGLAIAFFFYLLFKYLPTTSNIDVVLTFIAPYVMYLTAEHFHASGVIAVVSGGLFLSYRSHLVLTHESRLQSQASWSSFIFIINALVFMLMGLQLPGIMEDLKATSLFSATMIGLVISGICIVIRLLWVIPSLQLPKAFGRGQKTIYEKLDWKSQAIVGWSGMRGIISLAAAINIPIYLANGELFPFRNLILYITVVVIFVTLVVQGLTLPLLIKALKFDSTLQDPLLDKQESTLKIKLSKKVLEELQRNHQKQMLTNPYLRQYVQRQKQVLNKNISKVVSDDFEEEDLAFKQEFREIYLDMLNEQRKVLLGLRPDENYSDDEIHHILRSLDMEEMLVMNDRKI